MREALRERRQRQSAPSCAPRPHRRLALLPVPRRAPRARCRLPRRRGPLLLLKRADAPAHLRPAARTPPPVGLCRRHLPRPIPRRPARLPRAGRAPQRRPRRGREAAGETTTAGLRARFPNLRVVISAAANDRRACGMASPRRVSPPAAPPRPSLSAPCGRSPSATLASPWRAAARGRGRGRWTTTCPFTYYAWCRYCAGCSPSASREPRPELSCDLCFLVFVELV